MKKRGEFNKGKFLEHINKKSLEEKRDPDYSEQLELKEDSPIYRKIRKVFDD